MDISRLKIELYNEFLQENPSEAEAAAFLKALVRVENALDPFEGSRLNDEVPDSVLISHLQHQYDEAVRKIEKLEKEVAGKEARLRQFLDMDKAGRRNLRMDERAQYLQERIRKLTIVNQELIQKLNAKE